MYHFISYQFNRFYIRTFSYVIFKFVAKDIVAEIKKCKVMTALRMEGNTLGVDAAKAIAETLETHKEFQVISAGTFVLSMPSFYYIFNHTQLIKSVLI